MIFPEICVFLRGDSVNHHTRSSAPPGDRSRITEPPLVPSRVKFVYGANIFQLALEREFFNRITSKEASFGKEISIVQRAAICPWRTLRNIPRRNANHTVAADFTFSGLHRKCPSIDHRLSPEMTPQIRAGMYPRTSGHRQFLALGQVSATQIPTYFLKVLKLKPE